MRRVLVDHARYRLRAKRDAETVSLSFDEHRDPTPTLRLPELIALDDALSDLARHEPEMARIVELRFFGGLNREQIAVAMQTSSRTVTRRWRLARAWLTRQQRPFINGTSGRPSRLLNTVRLHRRSMRRPAGHRGRRVPDHPPGAPP